MEIINEDIINDDYKKIIIKEDDGNFTGKFVNTKHNITLYEITKPLKSTASSMVGTFIKKFDFVKDANRGVPQKRENTTGKVYSPTTKTKQKPPYEFAMKMARIHGEEVEEINGITVHFVKSKWASNLIFRHKVVNYSFDI